MNDPLLRGLNLIIYLDDASRCITGFRLFQEATFSNVVLTQVMCRFGTPATILSDNGRCFVGAGKLEINSIPRVLDHDIELINSRPHHPQTNNKIDRSFRMIKELYHNNECLHTSLDVDHFKVSRSTFLTKTTTNELRTTKSRTDRVK